MKRWVLLALLTGLAAGGCSADQYRTTGVYMLLDTSATDAAALRKAQSAVNFFLGTLQPQDTLALASIGTGSFSEKDIIARTTFDRRPTVANNQKRAFQKKTADRVAEVKSSDVADISGGILQAIEYLNAVQAGRKVIFIFSDLKQEGDRGGAGDVGFQLSGFAVIVLNPAAGAGIPTAADTHERTELWRSKIENGNGRWHVVEKLDEIDAVFTR